MMVQVVTCVAVLALICGAAALLTRAKNSAEHDVYKAVYHPPTKAEIDEQKAEATNTVKDMPEGDDKVRALARAEREHGIRTLQNWWEALSDEARTAVSVAVMVLVLAAVVQLCKPRRGW